jgi:uncharacterized protein (UPF0264 family)
VSVRSPVEAEAAVAGGAAIIDIKEPLHGSLGRASPSVWGSIRKTVPASIPVSVALGELSEWIGARQPNVAERAWSGIGFCKIGLSDAPADWVERWRGLRRDSAGFEKPSPAWVAVVYTDWEAAGAPDPDAVIHAAIEAPECRAILFDTWRKPGGALLHAAWKPRIERAKNSGLWVALAGSLDVETIRRLATFEPEIFAVRGAACLGGDRLASIDRERVARLVDAARGG